MFLRYEKETEDEKAYAEDEDDFVDVVARESSIVRNDLDGRNDDAVSA